MLSLALIGCDAGTDQNNNAIEVGAIIPFSGEQAALGTNIEQALILAINDVNTAGGINGRPLELVIRDSNSGSDHGYAEVEKLIHDKEVKYLIGPEDNTLAKKMISDIKAKNILHILPGIAAPAIRDTGDRGAWIRLAPSAGNVGCAMATKAIQEGCFPMLSAD